MAKKKKGNTDHHSRAKSLDVRGGDTRDGLEAELSSYGQGGRVLGPVVGAFGEMSDDVKELASTLVEERARAMRGCFEVCLLIIFHFFFLSVLLRASAPCSFLQCI